MYSSTCMFIGNTLYNVLNRKRLQKMRFIPTFCLQEGMILGKSIYNKSGALLLKEGLKMKQPYIDKVIDLGISGVYIEDDISKGIEIENVISDELRLNTVQKIKDIFIDAENDSNKIEENTDAINLLVEDLVDELIDNQDVIINMLDIKMFDDYTFFHSVNVAILSIVIGIGLNLSKKELNNLGVGALLHDIGKTFIPRECLNKKGKLSDAEFEQIKGHSIKGYQYIRSRFNLSIQSAMVVLDHHERYDGTGYPNKKTGQDISLFGRIVAIADVYDAITSDRPYRKAILPSKAMEYIMGGSGYHFDYDLISIFVRKVAAYPLGTCVKLSNGLIGIVVKNYPDASTRPKIRLINEKNQKAGYINLREDLKNNNLTIVEMMDM